MRRLLVFVEPLSDDGVPDIVSLPELLLALEKGKLLQVQFFLGFGENLRFGSA